jgi:hypothetical protein
VTTPKRSLALPSRTPAYVDRETGAAELMVSPETWDRWVDEGRLPPPAKNFPDTVPRWRWKDVDARMRGAAAEGDGDGGEDPFVAAARRLRDGPPKGTRRAAA